MIPIVENYNYTPQNIIGFALCNSKGLNVNFKTPQSLETIFQIFGNVSCEILVKEKIDEVWYIKEFTIIAWSQVHA